MQDFGTVIYKEDIKAFIIKDGTYMVPSPDDKTVPEEIHKEFDPLYAEIEEYVKENPDKLTIYVPEQPPVLTLEEAKAIKIQQIDKEASNAILSGFDYEIEAGSGLETLHFSYDSFDQQNFADTANVSILILSYGGDTESLNASGFPTSVTWNAYRNYTKETGGELVRLTLNAQEFLNLYTNGALIHKSTQMEIAGQRKELVSAAQTIEELENI